MQIIKICPFQWIFLQHPSYNIHKLNRVFDSYNTKHIFYNACPEREFYIVNYIFHSIAVIGVEKDQSPQAVHHTFFQIKFGCPFPI